MRSSTTKNRLSAVLEIKFYFPFSNTTSLYPTKFQIKPIAVPHKAPKAWPVFFSSKQRVDRINHNAGNYNIDNKTYQR
jgi:hypothetical protein